MRTRLDTTTRDPGRVVNKSIGKGMALDAVQACLRALKIHEEETRGRSEGQKEVRFR